VIDQGGFARSSGVGVTGITDGQGIPIVPGAQSFLLKNQDIISGYLAFRRCF
jgi:hypothetical protein